MEKGKKKMKHPNEIEEHVYWWLREGYSVPQIRYAMEKAILKFKNTKGYHDVEKYYPE